MFDCGRRFRGQSTHIRNEWLRNSPSNWIHWRLQIVRSSLPSSTVLVPFDQVLPIAVVSTLVSSHLFSLSTDPILNMHISLRMVEQFGSLNVSLAESTLVYPLIKANHFWILHALIPSLPLLKLTLRNCTWCFFLLLRLNVFEFGKNLLSFEGIHRVRRL